jgi:hypothetical protein
MATRNELTLSPDFGSKSCAYDVPPTAQIVLFLGTKQNPVTVVRKPSNLCTSFPSIDQIFTHLSKEPVTTLEKNKGKQWTTLIINYKGVPTNDLGKQERAVHGVELLLL